VGSSGIHVALLRGINVGGKNRLAMTDLAGFFAKAGCTGVRTYIQSGNVVFTAEAGVAGRLAEAVSAAIHRKLGLTVPVVVRTAAELGFVARSNPFLKKGAPADALHVMFLAGMPAAKAVAALDAKRSPGDALAVRGREIYLHLPNGVARSKLTNQYFDSTLGTTSTSRNWRTVLKLVELTGG
jgi:uncharacterized protein (DUF1697 family)